MKLSTLTQFSSDAHRFREIVAVFTKYELANWIKEHDPDFIKGLQKSSNGARITDLSPEVRLRMALTERM